MNPQEDQKIVAYVGIDWADQEHLCAVQSVKSNNVDSIKVKNHPENILEWILKLRASFKDRKIAVAIVEQRLSEIRSAIAISNDPAIIESNQLMVQSLVLQLKVIAKGIRKFEKQIQFFFVSTLAIVPKERNFTFAIPVLHSRFQLCQA